ncbi:MAG: glycosyltransferase family 2 protein, partial [Candidatus Margulisbacteria bacterium]|nr:glycosyltransferase family 2 protein [Candidatus Margulisiibacteriota bacterium]
FYARLVPVLQTINLSFEIIFVNDGSSDRSLEILTKLNQSDPRVKYISFSRNFGHMLALTAGLDACNGEAAITIDADLQHPPEVIPELVEKWISGAMAVNTLRRDTQGAGIIKKITAGFFYWLINRIAKINLPANAADYRLLDRKVIDTLKGVRERSRFLRGLISWVGYKQAFVEYTAEKRFAGRTKYSFSRMFAFAIDGITSFSSSPLKLSIYLGLIIAFFSFVYIVYALYIRLFTAQAIAGWTSVLVAVLFIGGIQLISLGIIGEYLSRVFDETKQRPLYIIDEKVGF